MIFGFNTDIRRDDTVYHVQSEARESERLLQTQVFVRGRCIGKRAVPYAASATEGVGSAKASSFEVRPSDPMSNRDDQMKEQRLRELHREVLDAIREGRLDSIFDKRDTPETLAAIEELELEWVNANSPRSPHDAAGPLTVRIRVTRGGTTLTGARVTLRFTRPDAPPYYAQVLTDASGNAEMNVPVDENALPNSSLLVQASFAGDTATRKFQLRRA